MLLTADAAKTTWCCGQLRLCVLAPLRQNPPAQINTKPQENSHLDKNSTAKLEPITNWNLMDKRFTSDVCAALMGAWQASFHMLLALSARRAHLYRCPTTGR